MSSKKNTTAVAPKPTASDPVPTKAPRIKKIAPVANTAPVPAPKVVAAPKPVSNTQRCASMIVQLAKDAKYTRQEIVATVADALSVLSVVTVKTMLSDLHNPKYARRYAEVTIATDRESKKVSIAGPIPSK